MIGDKLIGKLWDTVVREGVGSLASPWQTRRQGKANIDARRDELLMLAQTENDVADIRAGRKIFTEDHKLVSLKSPANENSEAVLRGGRIEPTFSLEEVRNNTLNTRQARDIQEQVNVTKAVLFAEEELESNYTEGSEEDLDSDWFARWRDSVEKISSEDLQRLWAKALAGELANPGSYSLRTLEFIKNISKSEAHEISRLAPFAISDSVYQVKAIEDAGLDFGYLLEMEDLGILSGVKGGGLQLTLGSREVDSYERALFHNNKILHITHESSSKKAELEVYKVTKLGLEVLRLGVFPMNSDYLEQVGNKVKAQGFKVIIADWVQTTKTHGNYFNAREL